MNKTNKPKVYRHKKLGWVAEYFNKEDCYYIRCGGDWNGIEIPKELIEDSLDRELQPEKDWIDRLVDEIKEGKIAIRDLIELHMPKISKEELLNIGPNFVNTKGGTSLDLGGTIQLLKDKGLYNGKDN